MIFAVQMFVLSVGIDQSDNQNVKKIADIDLLLLRNNCSAMAGYL